MTDVLIRSVSEVTALVADRLGELPSFVVEGEVSNLHPPNASGHLYFSLIDDKAKLNVAFFAFRQKAQGALPAFKNGDKVRVTGTISVYAPHGSYHLNATRVELCNSMGELLMRFEMLKRQLHAEGLCDPERKRKIPLLPKRIGVVTSPTGAAIRDILNILNRRFSNLHIIIAPCRVQGNEAAEEIAAGIRLLNKYFAPDTSTEPMDAMIVGRGGGSYEELWPFNEECVARAIVDSKIPVISAVGHEPDIAISDFVADLRAPTPSAAAELICGRKEDLERQTLEKKDKLIKLLRLCYAEARTHVKQVEASPLFRDPIHLIERYAQGIDTREDRLKYALMRSLAETKQHITQQQHALEQQGNEVFFRARTYLTQSANRLDVALQTSLQIAQNRLVRHTSTLKALDPTAVLKRGYALVTDATGNVITRAESTSPGAQVQIRLSEGALSATVDSLHPEITTEADTTPSHSQTTP